MLFSVSCHGFAPAMKYLRILCSRVALLLLASRDAAGFRFGSRCFSRSSCLWLGFLFVFGLWLDVTSARNSKHNWHELRVAELKTFHVIRHVCQIDQLVACV